jgi:DNA-binding protein YbaB
MTAAATSPTLDDYLGQIRTTHPVYSDLATRVITSAAFLTRLGDRGWNRDDADAPTTAYAIATALAQEQFKTEHPTGRLKQVTRRAPKFKTNLWQETVSAPPSRDLDWVGLVTALRKKSLDALKPSAPLSSSGMAGDLAGLDAFGRLAEFDVNGGSILSSLSLASSGPSAPARPLSPPAAAASVAPAAAPQEDPAAQLQAGFDAPQDPAQLQRLLQDPAYRDAMLAGVPPDMRAQVIATLDTDEGRAAIAGVMEQMLGGGQGSAMEMQQMQQRVEQMRAGLRQTEEALNTEAGRAQMVADTRQQLALFGMDPAAIDAEVARLQAMLATEQARADFMAQAQQQLEAAEQQLELMRPAAADGPPAPAAQAASPSPIPQSRNTFDDFDDDDNGADRAVDTAKTTTSTPGSGIVFGSYGPRPGAGGSRRPSKESGSGFPTRGQIALLAGLLALAAIAYRRPLGQWLARARQIGA